MAVPGCHEAVGLDRKSLRFSSPPERGYELALSYSQRRNQERSLTESPPHRPYPFERFQESTCIQRIDRQTEQQIRVIDGFASQRLAGGG